MKRLITFKQLLFVALVAAAGSVNAQVHALHFGSWGTNIQDNWYKNYVGLRLEVVAPTTTPPGIAGDKQYKIANDGTGATGMWGSAITASIVAVDVVMPQPGDSLAGSPITTAMTGKIALVYRGGGIEFVCKALAAQNAGAIAVVIINNVGGGPVGMGAGSVCSAPSITVPVFMISKADGDAIDAAYCSGYNVKMTITNWGLGNAKDLGFVPGGTANWHNFAIPANQVTGTGITAYKGLDGAFIANYGTTTQTNVKVSGTLSFTPNGGSTTQVHTDTVSLPSFPASDSIWAMFDTLTSNNEYDVTASGKGRFDLTYNISSTTGDDYLYDNTMTTSFYTTDSVYSKGRYDFTANEPLRTEYFRFGTGTAFLWGNMYFVAKGGAAVSKVQYSLDLTTTGPFADNGNNVYMFKWVDGDRGLAADGIVEDGELEIVGVGTKAFDHVNDTSGALLEVTNMRTDSVAAEYGTGSKIVLQDNTWYYLAVGVPAGYYLGTDGILDPYPRVFGRAHAVNSVLDYSNVVINNVTDFPDMYAFFGDANTPTPSAQVTFINSIDSFNYNSAKGLIPAIAMIVSADTTNPPIDHTNVKAVSKPAIGVTIYPNPAADHLTVSLDLDKFATSVKYTLIDGLGRIVNETTHTNLQREQFDINTSVLAPGHYFLIINANDQVTYKKFVVAK